MMGRFKDGWEQAQAAAEAEEAEKRRRGEAVAAALKSLSDALAADGEVLAQQNLTLRVEHGALVMKRLVEPLAGVTFDPDRSRFKIHKYTSSDDTQEDEAKDIDECALKLGAYAFALKT